MSPLWTLLRSVSVCRMPSGEELLTAAGHDCSRIPVFSLQQLCLSKPLADVRPLMFRVCFGIFMDA